MKDQFPRWEQLPQIALYMDQVLLVLNETLEPVTAGKGPAVTSTMINNYVKMKLAAPARKKKYDREHMARFLMICLMKQVLSMTEIAAILRELEGQFPLEVCYNGFCQELENRLEHLEGPDGADCPPVLAAAIRAVACKITVERLLEPQEEPEEK